MLIQSLIVSTKVSRIYVAILKSGRFDKHSNTLLLDVCVRRCCCCCTTGDETHRFRAEKNTCCGCCVCPCCAECNSENCRYNYGMCKCCYANCIFDPLCLCCGEWNGDLSLAEKRYNHEHGHGEPSTEIMTR